MNLSKFFAFSAGTDKQIDRQKFYLNLSPFLLRFEGGGIEIQRKFRK